MTDDWGTDAGWGAATDRLVPNLWFSIDQKSKCLVRFLSGSRANIIVRILSNPAKSFQRNLLNHPSYLVDCFATYNFLSKAK